MHICTHIYLHPCISTQYNGEILYTISIPKPNTKYPIPHHDHGEISQTNWAPNCPAVRLTKASAANKCSHVAAVGEAEETGLGRMPNGTNAMMGKKL